MKNSKKIARLLLILILAIWGTIAYRIYDSMAADNLQDTSVTFAHVADKQTAEREYVYVNNVRDPFRYTPPVHRDTSPKAVAPKPKVVWTPPPFKLSGILMTNKRKTAMLEETNGAIFFLHEGDTLSGMKVLKIKEKSVTYLYQKKKTDWILDNIQN